MAGRAAGKRDSQERGQLWREPVYGGRVKVELFQKKAAKGVEKWLVVWYSIFCDVIR